MNSVSHKNLYVYSIYYDHYGNRFVFYGSEAIKVDSAVNFPMEFKASDIYHGNGDDRNDDCIFKLVAAVCHFGG